MSVLAAVDRTYLRTSLQAVKSIFVEPMRATADEFDAVLSRYKGAASAGRGAVLFGKSFGRPPPSMRMSMWLCQCMQAEQTALASWHID